MLQVLFAPQYYADLLVFILGSQWTSWELLIFSAYESDRKKLPREKKYCLYVCIYYTTLHTDIYIYKDL